MEEAFTNIIRSLTSAPSRFPSMSKVLQMRTVICMDTIMNGKYHPNEKLTYLVNGSTLTIPSCVRRPFQTRGIELTSNSDNYGDLGATIVENVDIGNDETLGDYCYFYGRSGKKKCS
ncbi:unnamed protein product [Ambrosiozyma monospora]|uniref:Unnamed protein product n=1 Tax=Ambrosiozyma monospora TaxID=43982 RepID=A0ACB5ST67_AMBMO|nr:unnamed protein product [Ambrosiozyma monospora]